MQPLLNSSPETEALQTLKLGNHIRIRLIKSKPDIKKALKQVMQKYKTRLYLLQSAIMALLMSLLIHNETTLSSCSRFTKT